MRLREPFLLWDGWSSESAALPELAKFDLNALDVDFLRRLLLNPVVLFIWLIFWGWLWGVPGALMAVPLLAIVKIVCDHVQPLAPLAEFIEQ